MASNENEIARDVTVGDVYDVDGIEWKVHRIAHGRVAACNYVDDHGLRHYRTFPLTKLRTSRLVEIPHRQR